VWKEVKIMRKTYGQYGVLWVLVLALLLGLLLMAGTASAATTTTNTVTFTMTGILDEGDPPSLGQDGTVYVDNWVASAVIYRATGPDGWRCLGYGVVCLDVTMPPKGNNYHTGEMAFLSKDPWTVYPDGTTYWDAGRSFEQNLADHAGDLVWTGTWNNGVTLNKRLHKADCELTGQPGTVAARCTAELEVQSGNFDVANWHSGRYVGTPWNCLVRITRL
jgi:hypothetical protein